MALGGVDDHVGGLVDQGEILVFVEDFQRNIFGYRQIVGWLGKADLDVVIVADFVARLGRHGVDDYAAGLDDPLDDGPAEIGKHADQVLVEAHPFRLAFYGELDGPVGRKARRFGRQ